MLASTVQFSNNTQDRTSRDTSTPTEAGMTAAQPCRHIAWKERLFFQDPTVCRYINHQPATKDPPIRGRSCQRSTHELPPDYIRVRHGLCHNHIHLREGSWRSAP
jgi:hypothetical protein